MIQCSSDPNSTLNRLRAELSECNQLISWANIGAFDKSTAMTMRNHALANLRRHAHKLRGQKTKRLPVDFTTYACGIPCGVVIDYYSGDVEETEYTITTTLGYRMDWLEERVKADSEEDAMVAAEIQAYRGGDPW